MALIDKIIDRIWQAQNAEQKVNEAVVQKQAQYVASGEKAEKPTGVSKTPQKNSTYGIITEGASEPLPAAVRTVIAEKQAQTAKQEYDTYKSSGEAQKNQQEANRRYLDEAIKKIFAVPGVSASDIPLTRQDAYAAADMKGQELQAKADYYEGQAETARNEAVTEENLKELENWSEEDRNNLQKYITEQDMGQNNLFGTPGFDTWNLNPLIAKYGDKKVRQMAESLRWNQTRQATEDTARFAQETAKEHPIMGSLASVGTGLVGAVAGPVEYAKEIGQRTGQYSTLNPYNPGTVPGTFGGTVRQTVTEDIRGDGSSMIRNLSAVGYQGGMSALDNAVRLVASGGNAGISAAIAASSSFGQGLQQYSAQGATPAQAATMAFVDAGLEYATEKLSDSKTLEFLKGGSKPDLIKKFLWQTFGVEPLSEEVNLFAGVAAEAALLGDKSSQRLQIGEMVANGMSYEEASLEYWKSIWREAKQTYATSVISAGLSSAGTMLAGNMMRNAQQTGPTVDQLLDGVQDMTPAPEPLTEELQHFDNAAAIANGVQTVQQPAVDTTAQTEYDNNTITVPGATVGRSDVTYTADNKPVQFRYAVVPAESLVTSNDQYGNVNSAYPAELQPRDRTRAASQTQINSISRNLNPALLAESPTAQNGAPIIRGDGVVIGGNGRVSAIAQAYGAGRGAEYQQYITQRAAELGIDPATLPANPVLVRVTDGVDNYTELASSLNASTTASYSATEAANADAGKIGDIIEYLSVSEDGGINTADNRDFIQKFVAHVVPETERGDVMQANGQLSQAGERRIQNALFAYAYGDTALVERLAESTDNNAKNITNAMMGAAGKVAQLQTEINRGEVQDLGLQNAITDAVNLYLDAKAGKQTVEDAAGQLSIGDNGPEAQHDGLTVNLAKFMESNNRSGKQIRDFIDTLIDVNMNATADTATEISMFDTGERQTQEGLYDEAVTAYDQQRDGKGRIPEKSDFSQYRQYQPGELAGGVAEGRTEGNPGTAVPDGRITQTVPADAPGGQRNLTEQNPGIKGTGAAEGNFSGKPAYNATLSEDNSQADRRDDVRPMELPQQDINGGNVSAVTGNVYGSRITPDELASLMEEPTARGDFTYAKITNDQATQRATETIASAGTWENAYDSWKQSVSSGNAGAEMSARGALLLNHAAQQGDKQLWLETLHYMQKLGTNTAQGLQAFRIIRTLQPADKIEFVRMSVEKMAAEVKEKHGIDLELDQTLIDEFEQADTDEARDAVLEDIQQNVADQIPSTFLDKWTALRYMNMLGNLKTNVRNIAGNVGSAAVYRIKDTIATGMEAIASKVSGGNTERTKSLFVRKSLLDACKEDFRQFKETVSSGGKYGERMSATSQFAQGVQDKRRIFNNPALEAYRKGTNWMMNNEHFGDEAFGRAAYARALAGYLQANGVTGSDLSEVDSTLLDKARTYAVKEAQEATFHDNSTLAQIVSKVQKDTGVVGQGIMPFTKTPANVLTRAEEFSPLGLINSTVKSVQKARGNENITGADVINSWAKTMTGVGLFALGAAMMDQGLLAGGPDEDEEKDAFDELNGQQNYAIQLPDGTNYTIDWLTPAAMPMFMGAQFWKMFSSDRDLTFADVEQVFTSIADPMIQMSMLQGLNDSLDGIKYSDNNLGQFLINAAVSYLTQGLTNTLLGQLERSSKENRMTTFVDKDSAVPQWMQRQLGKMSQKVPGWDYQQAEYLNAWGQQDKNEGGLLYNLLSPGYISTEQQTAVTRELNRLRETTGENVFPQTVERSVNFTDTDGTKHTDYNLSGKEYEIMQKVQGQTSYRLMFEVISNSDYASLTDKQKAQVIDNIYSYAQEEARKQALPKYYSEAPAWMREIGEETADGLIRRAALSTINTAVTNTVDNIENGWTVTPAATQDLNALYEAYDSMSQEAKKQILDDAISDTVKYLEIRSRGISTDQYLDVVTDIKALKPEPNYSAIRDIQTREAIAENDSLSTREKDYVMKAYMTDYDPTAKSPEKTELKYDAIRDLGVSPEGYTAAYRDYLDASGTGKRSRTIAQYMKSYGWDRSTAQKVYDIYAGYYKPWE